MKKNKFMRLASVLLVAVLLSTCAISGTFAKYTSTTSGSDTARVAKWAFDLEGNTTLANTYTFDLFSTIADTNTATDDADVANATNTDATTTQIIAPGTQGSFELNLENKSEVNATYAIDYTITNSNNIPILFSIDNGTTWTTTLADVTATAIAMADATAGSGNDTVSITIKWKWDFADTYIKTTDTALDSDKTYYTEAAGVYTAVASPNVDDIATYYELLKNDDADTNLGKMDTAPTITVQAVITVTQVD